MIYKTHTTFSLSLTLIPFSLGIITLTEPEQFILLLITSYIFSLAPDFDEPGSYLSKRFPWMIISHIISAFTTHRGVTHRFLAPFIVMAMFSPIIYFYPAYSYILVVIFISYLGHLIGDGFTIGGLKRFYYPFSKKTVWFLPKFLRFKTGSFIENIWLLIFTFSALIQIYLIIIRYKGFGLYNLI